MTTAIKTYTLPALADGLTAYINAVQNLPLLSEEEERTLATRLIEHNDTEAARRLVLANLRLVVSVSRGFSGYGLNQGDLIQEGNIGLLKAVRRFDPSRGARLATFAMYWIRAEMHDFIVRNWRIVKIATTKAQRKLFFHKHRLLRNSDNREAETLAIARDLSVRPEEVEEMRGRLYNTEAVSLSSDDEDAPGSEAYLADQSPAADVEETIVRRRQMAALETAMQQIGEREREILSARRLADPPQTLQALSDKFGVSVERVRQIENAALKKLTAFVQTAQA